MKKTVKKAVKKTAKKTDKAYKMPKISKTMATETVLARMIDIEDRADRVAVLVEYLKGADRAFGSAVLQRMTRESCALTLEASGAVYKPTPVPEPLPLALPLTLDSAVVGASVDNPPDPDGPNPVITDIVVGPYSSSWAADQDVQQFKHPKVMQYRSTVFPSPSTFAVEATVVTAKAIKLTDHPKLMPKQRTLAAAYPYAIQLQVRVTGDEKKVANWITAFNGLNHFTKVG
jgi:hypothetical protein